MRNTGRGDPLYNVESLLDLHSGPNERYTLELINSETFCAKVKRGAKKKGKLNEDRRSDFQISFHESNVLKTI